MTGEGGGPELTERDTLRAALGFPASVESGTAVPREVSQNGAHAPEPEVEPPTELATIAARLDEVTGRLDKLSAQSRALNALIDDLYERLDPTLQPDALTSEDLADIGARIVRALETRLESHTDRIRELLEAHDTTNVVELRERTAMRLP